MLGSSPLRLRATGLPSLSSLSFSLREGPVDKSHPSCTRGPPTSTCCVHAEASSREQTGIGPECPGEGLCGRSPLAWQFTSFCLVMLTAMLCTLATCCLARGGRVATPPSGWRSDEGPASSSLWGSRSACCGIDQALSVGTGRPKRWLRPEGPSSVPSMSSVVASSAPTLPLRARSDIAVALPGRSQEVAK